MTVKNNEEDLKERENKFDLVWKTLNRDYFTKDEVEEKFNVTHLMVKSTYGTIETHVAFVEKNKKDI